MRRRRATRSREAGSQKSRSSRSTPVMQSAGGHAVPGSGSASRAAPAGETSPRRSRQLYANDPLMIDIVRRPVPDSARALAASGMHPVLARVLASRGVASASDLPGELATLPPFATMKGIDAAAARLADAIVAREKIMIVADYDADGATACAVGVRGLRALGANVGFLVPNRFEYGYGLTPEIVAEAVRLAPHVLV